MDLSLVLPEECISHIFSFTSPPVAGRLSTVSREFRSAADSDAVWEKFLPPDYREMIPSKSVLSSSLLASLSKKEVYLHLCNNPILMNDATMSLSLDKGSGKKCCRIGARALSISWEDNPNFWSWISLPESRFPEVAELKFMRWMHAKATIETKILSPQTNYAAYFVYKFADSKCGFETRSVQLSVYFEGTDPSEKNYVLLDVPAAANQLSLERVDGWMEVEMGEFFTNKTGDNNGKIVCSLFDLDGFNKRGLIIEGIELRPKYCR